MILLYSLADLKFYMHCVIITNKQTETHYGLQPYHSTHVVWRVCVCMKKGTTRSKRPERKQNYTCRLLLEYWDSSLVVAPLDRPCRLGGMYGSGLFEPVELGLDRVSEDDKDPSRRSVIGNPKDTTSISPVFCTSTDSSHQVIAT